MFDLGLWIEIFQSMNKNRTRSILSGFTVAFAILLFTILIGISNGLGGDANTSLKFGKYIIEEIAGVKLERKYIKGPLGVRGRNSDNTDVKKLLNWEPKISLKEGLTKTYEWIYDQYRTKQ